MHRPSAPGRAAAGFAQILPLPARRRGPNPGVLWLGGSPASQLVEEIVNSTVPSTTSSCGRTLTRKASTR
jgi:hypothetical protein